MKYLFFSLVLMLSATLLSAQEKIEVTSEPAFDEIGPDVTVAKLRFKLPEKLRNQKLRIELWCPPKQSFISTDFPIVEGTKLIDSTVYTEADNYELDYLYPIRGEYRLKLTSGDYVQEESFSLNENSSEVMNFTILVFILAIFGLISGLVIGKGAYSKAAAQSLEMEG
ncbi:MAG: hypothetical protein MK132_06250 [Lentisphaerales bacterium]|nr:hypothetical protein [Lentisphaerales bacterium]